MFKTKIGWIITIILCVIVFCIGFFYMGGFSCETHP